MNNVRRPADYGRSALGMTGKLEFGVEFQKMLLRLLCEDKNFANVAGPFLEPEYFATEMHAWFVTALQAHYTQYDSYPSLSVMHHNATAADQRVRQMYELFVQQVAQQELSDIEWLKDRTLDFIKRAIFIRTHNETTSLFNSGKHEEAFKLSEERAAKLSKTAWAPVDESRYFEEFDNRMWDRQQVDPSRLNVTTGIPSLDKVLGGGLGIGELGIWIAYPKCGKSTLLVNLGLAATRFDYRKTAHFVFEGSRRQVEARYDAAFMHEWYGMVKRGEADQKKLDHARYEFGQLRGLLRIRGFTDGWDHSVLNIWDTLREWEMKEGWRPEVLIIDYGDLLAGRNGPYKSETEKQKDAFRDMKQLANREYTVWTASQAQRPDKGADEREHLIKSRDIADCYEKIRVADFLGSINMTLEEKRGELDPQTNQWLRLPAARLYAELYRDNEADQVIPVVSEFGRMRMYEPSGFGDAYRQRQPAPPPGYSQQSALG